MFHRPASLSRTINNEDNSNNRSNQKHQVEKTQTVTRSSIRRLSFPGHFPSQEVLQAHFVNACACFLKVRPLHCIFFIQLVVGDPSNQGNNPMAGLIIAMRGSTIAISVQPLTLMKLYIIG